MLFVNQYQNFKNSFVLSRLINYGRKEHTRINPEGAPQKAITDFQVYDKGCACFLEGEKYPMRAHIVDTKVSACCNMKRLIPLITRFILGKGEFSKSNWFQRFVRALEIKDTYPLFKEFVHFTLMDEFLELNRYSQPVRELYRVIPEKWSKERDIACFFLEYDMAYRYRFQDVLVELDKEAFKNNPAKEIGRLFDILSSREGDNEGDYSLTARWGALKNLGILYLNTFGRKLVKELIPIVENINLDEIRSSPEDKYWQAGYENYKFGGLDYKTRQMLKNQY